MNTRAIVRFLILPFIFLSTGCGSGSTPLLSMDDPSSQDPTIVDPLLSLYGNWLTECVDFGGGEKNEIFANIRSDGSINLAVLSWANDGCSGPYTLSNFNGDPLTGPETLNTFELEDVSDIPDDFFVLKLTNTDDSGITYGIFHVLNDEFFILNDFETSHKTWDGWLNEDDVSGFVEDPEGYVPLVKSVIHFNAVSGIPDPLASLYGNWLSDCVDFGGGAYNQIFSTFDATQPKTAILTWTELDCAGTYSLSDIAGNPIAEPVQSQTIKFKSVLAMPLGIFTPKVTNLSDDGIIYPVIDMTGENEFYELVPFDTHYDTWAEWLAEPTGDVSGFVDDPAGFTPSMDHLKFHFIRSDLPPT